VSAERIRLLILTNSLAPYGAENFILNHVRHHDRRRYQITVCYFRAPHTLGPALREAGAEVVCLDEVRRPSPGAIFRLGHLIRRRRFDVLQTHIAYAGMIGRVVGRATQVPAVISTEQTVRHDLKGALGRGVDVTFGLAHQHVYITQAVRRSFHGEAGAPIITNGIDAEDVADQARRARAQKRAELGLADGDLAFGNVGRLHPNKGQRFAIEALAKVRARLPRASLWIVGEGDRRAELAAWAEAHRVGDRVHLLGQRLDVHALLGAFDAYVHPATTEALGIAVLEAMAAGLPTIASAVDGIPEFVRHGETGWLVPSGDADELAERMIAVGALGPDVARVALAGRALVRRDHDVRAAVAAYESLYESLLGRRAA
jgi:L-malate glycosyltransferase